MDQKKGPKKPLKPGDDNDSNEWDCSVCTYRNHAEAFKCAVCDIRKGTSTRKPRVNSQIVAQQIAQQYVPTPPKVPKPNTFKKNTSPNKRSSATRSKLKNIDHSSAHEMEVTVGNVTVVITDYKLLPQKDDTLSPPPSPRDSVMTEESEDNTVNLNHPSNSESSPHVISSTA